MEVISEFGFSAKRLVLLPNDILIVYGGSGLLELTGYNRMKIYLLGSTYPPQLKVGGELSLGVTNLEDIASHLIGRSFNVWTITQHSCTELTCLREKNTAGTSSDFVDKGGVRRRKGAEVSDEQPDASFRLQTQREILFPKLESDPSIRFIRISGTTPDDCTLALALSGGRIHVYTYSQLDPSKTEPPAPSQSWTAHTGEITDMDLSPDGKRLATICTTTGEARIWRTKDASQTLECTNRASHQICPTSAELVIRNGRFGHREGVPDAVILYTTHVARQRPSSAGSFMSFLTSWDCTRYSERNVIELGIDPPTVLAVSQEGRYIALGGERGGLQVFIAFSLKRIYNVELSGGPTALIDAVFLSANRAESNRNDVELLTLNAGQSLRFHRVSQRTSISVMWPIIATVVTIIFIFYCLGQFGI